MGKNRRGARRGHSNAGRPRKDGERYANGRLKPKPANPKVIEMRKAILGADAKSGNLHLASDPIDLAYARGWLTEDEHRAAKTLEQLHHQAGFGAPRMTPAALCEVQPALNIEARNFSVMSDAEVVEIWDKVFSAEIETDREQQAERALRLWTSIMARLKPHVRAELFSVCIASSWPQWIVFRAADRPMTTGVANRRDYLIEGLGAVRQVMASARRRTAEVVTIKTEPRPRRPSGPKVAQTTFYVDAQGAPVLEVVTLSRRAS